MMTSRSLICLLENQNGGKLQKMSYYLILTYDEFSLMCARSFYRNYNGRGAELLL
jgi:hypothetical protein